MTPPIAQPPEPPPGGAYDGPPSTGGYPPRYDQQPGYPPYPYAYGPYPPFHQYGPRPDPRPGTATGAAVLGFVASALLLLSSLFLVTGASVLHSIDHAHAGELLIDGLLDLLMAALLIGGGVALLSRSRTGRMLLTVGAAGVVVDCVYWVARWEHLGQFVSLAFYVGVFGVLGGVALLLAWLPDTTRWLADGNAAGDARTVH